MVRQALPFSFKRIAIALALTVSGTFAPTALAEKYASIVVNIESDEVLHARHADATRYPASLTKVMTLYMLFDALKAGEITLDEKMTVSRFAAAQAPSNLKLRAGSKIRVGDAIDALITKSANDVAVVVAERLGGSEARFSRLMTVKAKSLGMENTRFVNASGLPDKRQVSTARDMSKLAEAMIDNHRDYYHWFSQTSFTYRGKTYKNHNELLGKVIGVDGIKTGYTRASGFNLMTSAERDGERIVAIMLGGRTSRSRNTHVTALVEAAFASMAEKAMADDTTAERKAFADVKQPLHPDAAAEPMLNGQKISAIIAEGDSDEIVEDTQTADIGDAANVSDDLKVAQAVEVMVKKEIVAEAPSSKPVSTAVPTSPKTAMTVQEYELRQTRSLN